MSNPDTVYLMYHELELPGRPLCQTEQGYVRYVCTAVEFRQQLERLKASRLCGRSVTDGLRGNANRSPGVVITFDDGCETDLLAAAPLLQEYGFGATFYVVAGFLGRPGYLTPAQLRELASLGYEIGCHSMTHPFLTDLGPEQLRTEIVAARDCLEQIIGKKVEHFSCPGGRWNVHVAAVARESGYRTVATSRIGTNSPTTDAYRLARIAVLRGTSTASFDQLCRAEGLLLMQAREGMLYALKKLFGNSAYEKIRSVALNRR